MKIDEAEYCRLMTCAKTLGQQEIVDAVSRYGQSEAARVLGVTESSVGECVTRVREIARREVMKTDTTTSEV
jgi:DNA-binding transcriptional regulator YdaS (Cro superfamily)